MTVCIHIYSPHGYFYITVLLMCASFADVTVNLAEPSYSVVESEEQVLVCANLIGQIERDVIVTLATEATGLATGMYIAT